MENQTVIARGYGGKPLKRVALFSGNGLVYVANPAYLEAVESGDSQPVGFPPQDVFAFSTKDFEALDCEWKQRGATSPSLWASLTRAVTASRQG